MAADKAIEMAAVNKSFEAQRPDGKWEQVDTFEELRALIREADREVARQKAMAQGMSSGLQVADSLTGLPVSMGMQPGGGEVEVGAPSKLGLLTFARGIARHTGAPLGFLQEFHAKLGKSFQVKTPTHGTFVFDTRTDVVMDALKETDGGDDSFKKSELQGHGASFLIGKKNMFLTGGEDWAVVQTALRGHLTGKKVNSPEMVARLTGIFDDHLADLKAQAKAAPDGIVQFDSREAMQTAVLDVALQLFFSTKLPKSELKHLQDAFNTQMSWLRRRPRLFHRRQGSGNRPAFVGRAPAARDSLPAGGRTRNDRDHDGLVADDDVAPSQGVPGSAKRDRHRGRPEGARARGSARSAAGLRHHQRDLAHVSAVLSFHARGQRGRHHR
jgi:hypothetical protein